MLRGFTAAVAINIRIGNVRHAGKQRSKAPALELHCTRGTVSIGLEAWYVANDPIDVYLIDDRATELDLRPALREQWLLNVPGYALCRDDCQGLCPTCGAELNLGPCDCTPTSADPRWEGLRKLRDERR